MCIIFKLKTEEEQKTLISLFKPKQVHKVGAEFSNMKNKELS